MAMMAAKPLSETHNPAGQRYNAAGEFDEMIGAVNPYPRDATLDAWIEEFKALHNRGVRFIPDWGARTDREAQARINEVRAKAQAAGKDPEKAEAAEKDPDKAAMGARNAPVRTGWNKHDPAWPECERHLERGGWLSWRPEDKGAIELDIDNGYIDATAQVLKGMYEVAGETRSVSGKLRLIVRYVCAKDAKGKRKRPKKTWRLPEGAGECLAIKATVCDPFALTAALDRLETAAPADLSLLKNGGASKQADMSFEAEANEDELEAAVDDAVRKILDAPGGQGNNVEAKEAWRAGKSAGTSEAMDREAARRCEGGNGVSGPARHRQPPCLPCTKNI